jgi:hypothetical protein
MTKTEQNRVLACRLRDCSALRASSLRDRRREASGVQLGLAAKLSNPSYFMSGVRPTSR